MKLGAPFFGVGFGPGLVFLSRCMIDISLTLRRKESSSWDSIEAVYALGLFFLELSTL